MGTAEGVLGEGELSRQAGLAPVDSKPPGEGGDQFLGDGICGPHQVGLGDVALRRQHFVGQSAVIGDKDEALGVLVKASGRERPSRVAQTTPFGLLSMM